MGDVADAEGDRIGVEAPVLEGQRLGIALHEGQAIPRARPRLSRRQHLGADVAEDGARARPCRIQEAKGDVAGAARHVEQREGRWPLGRGKRVDQLGFPQAVQAPRHEVVHEVVAARDLGKHLVHQALALGLPYAREAEACLGFRRLAFHVLRHGPRTIA